MNESTTKQNAPEVYIGTYKKYNEGNLDGKWLTLTDYKNFDDFISACHEVHKDEEDPEFMCQDESSMPDGISFGECFSEKDFNDVITAYKESLQEDEEINAPSFSVIEYSEKAIAITGDTKQFCAQFKKIGGKYNTRLTCGPGWIFSKKKREEVESILNGFTVCNSCSSNESDSKRDIQRYKNDILEWQKLVEPESKYYYNLERVLKNYVGALKLEFAGIDHPIFVVLEKNSIKNKFCFSDEGEEYQFYRRLTADDEKLREYFIYQNTKGIKRQIGLLKKYKEVFIWNDNSSLSRRVTGVITEIDSYIHREDYKYLSLSDDQLAEIIKALEYQQECLNKRLNSYLKRWGVSKIRTWSYWVDA